MLFGLTRATFKSHEYCVQTILKEVFTSFFEDIHIYNINLKEHLNNLKLVLLTFKSNYLLAKKIKMLIYCE